MLSVAIDARAFGCAADAPPRCRREVRRLAIAGIAEMAPILVGLLPFAIAIGVAVAESPVDDLGGWAGGPLLFNGTSHLLAVSALTAGASWHAAAFLILVSNARLAIYSAAVSRQLGPQPAWFRWLASYFLVEPVFVLVGQRLERGTSREHIRAYYLTAGLAIWVVWLGAIALGVLAGPAIPSGGATGMVLPLVMIGTLAPVLHGSGPVASALIAGIVMASLPGAGAWGLAVAAVAGMVAGRAVDRTPR